MDSPLPYQHATVTRASRVGVAARSVGALQPPAQAAACGAPGPARCSRRQARGIDCASAVIAYPPPDHYLSELGLRLELQGDRAVVELEATRELCDEGGRLRLGVLATAVDITAGSLARLQAEPDWVATSDLALHVTDGLASGPCRAACRVVRRGRTLVTLGVELIAGDALLGLGTAAFAVLPSRGGAAQGGARRRPQPLATPTPVGEGRPLLERLGVRVADAAAGVVEMELGDYVRNTFGALQGGVVAVLAEAAMQGATGASLSELAVRYLSLGRQGPFRTRVRRIGATGAGTVCEAWVLDAGDGERQVALATGRTWQDPPMCES